MSTFQFDTSGSVRRPGFARSLSWSDLDAKEQSRVERAARTFWESLTDAEKDRLAHFGPVAFSDFTPRALVAAMARPVRLAINADGNLDLEGL